MASVLVTGGAGYIGSHTVKLLAARGYEVVTCDNLSRGYRDAVKWGDFVQADVRDSAVVERVIREYRVGAVVHFAAFMSVAESVENPAAYYENNVCATLSLLKTAIRAGVGKFVFSSTAAVYGEPREVPIREEHPTAPANPYGRSKLTVEYILEDLHRACGLRYVCLRYFNAAGADPSGEIGERHNPETHLVPLVLAAAAGASREIKIFGTDYPTPDGTCIRDYVHVNDLAEAHLLALQRLDTGGGPDVFNLGNGVGYSVREVIETAQKVTGRPVHAVQVPRRPGDPARLVASSEKATRVLGWKPALPGLLDILSTAWRFARSGK